MFSKLIDVPMYIYLMKVGKRIDRNVNSAKNKDTNTNNSRNKK